MRALRTCVIGGLAMMVPVLCRAQEPGYPVFQLQPGLMIVDFVSSSGGAPSRTGFNLRFATRLPTTLRWFTLVFGASVTPYGMSGIPDRNSSAPLVFIGNVFPAVSSARTGGWATLEVPLLLYQAYGGGGEHSTSNFGRDLYLQLSLYLHV